MKKLSIVDIAKQLNTSVTTVSFVINGKAEEMRISEPVVKKVMQLVKESGYKPNQLAQSFRTGKTKTIGLMLENIADPFFAQIAKHIEDAAYEKGYKIIHVSTDNNTDKAKELIKVFRQRKVDGFIITPPIGIEDDLLLLLKDNYPFILFDRYFSMLKTNYVGIDNFQSSLNAVEHLIQNGYKRTAMITIISEQTQMMERRRGYEKAMDKHGLLPSILEIPLHTKHEDIVSQLLRFFEANPKVDAIFVGTNYLAIRALEALKIKKIRIPDDVAVIAYDDHDLFRLYTPSITAVAQPVEAMSKQLVIKILQQIDGNEKDLGDQIIIPANLIVRESSIRNT
ncbi:LacI family DNA-binding transcriptional regulator [Mucilaginibacter terrae]|uniref:LacI family DNA-binding transcriptional regulator n=1 Tax=Mucilaginibacter terrae TaxID=1955052 RepID=UPI0036329ABC